MLSIDATVCLVAAVPAVASEPELTVGSTDQEIRIDGSLDEPAWHQAGAIPDLTQQDPHPGAPTPFTSEVRVLVSRDAIYIGFVCHDPEPSRVAIHTMQRDGNMTGDDTVAVVIDPVADGRRGYIFRINAAAARLDGLVSGPERMSTDWDGIWDASTQRTPDGWTAEIRIPTQTLRFKWGQDRWGFNVERYVPRTLTTFRWAESRSMRPSSICRGPDDWSVLAFCARASVFRSPLMDSCAPKRTSRAACTRSKVKREVTWTWNFTGDLTGYLTINPDFAETEVDTRQVNLTRFPLFFPEKRAFFLEGSDIFVFGSGLGSDFIPFFSRKMGLFEGEKIPLLGGAKVIGRAGRWRVAALGVAADETDVTQRTNLFSGRVTYDVDKNLTFGVIATEGDPEGERENSLGGIDVLWRTSTFNGNKNFSAGAWAALRLGPQS